MKTPFAPLDALVDNLELSITNRTRLCPVYPTKTPVLPKQAQNLIIPFAVVGEGTRRTYTDCVATRGNGSYKGRSKCAPRTRVVVVTHNTFVQKRPRRAGAMGQGVESSGGL